ncbi:MAG: type II toxin-antitoxin system PemK/MazF family toxin [Acidobacteria bacterium]|nr:type II toxin-antitoxin system PemK/MazF family toxin [Acidobacteriota bacterium]
MRRGEIYFVTLDPATGREQAGRRPVLVVSDDSINSKPLVVTVVVGSSGDRWPEDYPTNVRVPASESGLSKETVFLCFQFRSLDHSRFLESSGRHAKPAGRLQPTRLAEVDQAIRLALSLLN